MAIFMDRLIGIEVGLGISIKLRARYEDIDTGVLLELGGLLVRGWGGALKCKSSEKDEGLALIISLMMIFPQISGKQHVVLVLTRPIGSIIL